MSIFESIVYGLVSGLTEFLPVSSQGHQAIMMQLFGHSNREPFRDLIVHIAVILSLLYSCKPLFSRIRREHLLSNRSRRRRTKAIRTQYDLRLIKTAGFPMLLVFLVYFITQHYETKPIYLALFFCINGIVLIIPEYIRHGNKDARFMTGMDAFMLGLFGALSAFPGISRIGTMSAFCLSRGADRQHALNWLLVLTLPMLVVFMLFDIIGLFTIGFGMLTFVGFLGCLISGVMAFVGAYLGIRMIRFLTVRPGFAGFAYYSWGAALFSLVLYLIA